MSFTRIAHVRLTANSPFIEFSSIPVDGTYTGLILRMSSRSTRTSGVAGIVGIQFNNDTGTNYTYRYHRGWNGLVESKDQADDGVNNHIAINTTSAVYQSDVFGTLEIIIPRYNFTGAKAIGLDAVAPNLGTPYFVYRQGAQYSGTAPISSIKLFDSAGESFVSGTTASLFGILSGSDGVTTVT